MGRFRLEKNSNIHDLPSEFQEVEYIESTGTQWIDLGTKANYNSKVEIGFQFTENSPASGTGRIFGSRASGSNNAFFIGTHSGALESYATLFAHFDSVTGTQSITPTIDFDKNILILDKNGFSYDGVIIRTFEGATEFETPETLLLMAGRTSTGAEITIGTKAKCYYCKLWDGETLIRNLIPCYRKADNLIGMYDLANSGKNLWDYRNSFVGERRIHNGVTFTKVPYGIKCQGVASGQVYTTPYDMTNILEKNKTYVISANLNNVRPMFRYTQNGSDKFNTKITYSDNITNIKAYFYIEDGVEINDVVYMQIEEGSTATSYEAYPFYTNAGTGTFVKGNNVPLYIAKETSRYCLKLRMPDEYQPVEYIESTGTQYLDLGEKATQETSLEIEYQITQRGTDYAPLFGARNAYHDSGFLACFLSPAGDLYDNYYGTYFSNVGNTIDSWDTNKHKLKIENKKAYYDGNMFTDYSDAPNFETNNNVLIFAGYLWDSGLFTGTNARCYSFVFNNALFIPCYRKVDNVIGMYDLDNGVFYTNAGTGTFLKGNNASKYVLLPSYRYCLENRLPSEFQEVEYIETNGTQYINTNTFTVDVDTVEIKAALTNITHNVNQYFAGTRNLANTAIGYSLYFTAHGGVNYYPLTWANDEAGVMPSLNEIFTTKTEFKNGTTSFYYNEQLRDSRPCSQTDYNNGNVIFISAIRNIDGTPNYFSYAKYYEIKFLKNDEMVANFIPCYRKADNVIGMYDLVNNVFYTNAGSGEFVKSSNDINHYDIIRIL